MDPLERSRSDLSNSNRTFFSRPLTRRDGDTKDDSSEDAKGPFGLNTLYDPSVPAIADLIFVHGLGGGSRSTWTKSGNPTLYWPKEWLPKDPGFQDVRIHSFGYNSNWNKGSILNIHDFAKSLLGSIQDCPLIPRESNAPLVFVGHSMGGLVIKRAFILAKQNGEFIPIASRVRSIFFLATPHRGADPAQLLSKILNLSSGSRPFVEDLHRNSPATQAINDEFPHHCQGLRLYSFYETLPTSYGVGKSLVVDKDLATLGYDNERTDLINANHRGICKYGAMDDPNYLTVRNAIASIIDDFRKQEATLKQELSHEQRRLLESFLGVSDAPEDDLMRATNQRMTGSCEWLLRKGSFREWRDSTNTQIYWISAKPATGKTILSGSVVTDLRDRNQDCAFYFFNHGNKPSSSVSSFLLSMAWQMSCMNVSVRQAILGICKLDNQLNKGDYRTIWRKLYLEGILRVRLVHPQYWVIDALDECQAGSDLVPLLARIAELCPVRIFITSRDRYEAHRQIAAPKVKVVSEEIIADDTKSDITLYLQANMDQLPSSGDEAQEAMVAKILKKSDGCFLWVSLVLNELRQVHTSAEIRQALESVPSDMDELYLRILDSMSKAPYGKALTKSILTWTVCSARPLTIQELHHALQYDIGDTVDSVERAIKSNCDQLVYVDSQSRVRIIHQTAREFLLRMEIASEFAIDKSSAHKRLAMTCLQYLNGNEMRGPRHRKLSSSNTTKERSPFISYASNSLFEHITHVPSTDDDLLFAMAKFFSSSNVLSWIEYIVKTSELNRLIQAGKALRNFLQRRSRHMSPFGKEVALINSWATDLGRLVTKFGKILSAYPSTIFNLIPSFCPSETAPRRQFAASARGISVIGLKATTWDDCLSTVVDPQEQFTALACSNRYFAIGTNSGKILVFNETTCQQVQELRHEEPVRLLKFGCTKQVLASACNKVVGVWNTNSWELMWTFRTPHLCLSLELADEEQLLIAALKNNHLMIWDLTDGTLRDSTDWAKYIDGLQRHASRRPIAAAICVESYLLAVIYRGQDIFLWDLERDVLHDTYNKETGSRPNSARPAVNTGALKVAFGAGPSAKLLVAAYGDGDLVLFDTSEGTVLETILANVHTLATSPDGRTLAAGDSSGTIQLFDLETLKLLHRINAEDYGVKALAFSGDCQRLLDIGGSQCRVWDPMALLRQDADEENSDTISISTTPQETILEPLGDEVLVTSMICSKRGDFYFCGKDDGAVYLHETKSGQLVRKLFSHAQGVSIISLCFDEESQIITSSDSSSRIMSHKLIRQSAGLEVGAAVFEHRMFITIDQLLCNEGHARLLIASPKSDILWKISPDGSPSEVVSLLTSEDRGSYRWASHPTNPDQLILIIGAVAHLYDWESLKLLTGDDGILLEGSLLPKLAIRSITPCFGGECIATMFKEFGKPHSKSQFLLWDTSAFAVGSKSIAPTPSYEHLANHADYLIGSHGHKLVFLHTNTWVCSTDSHNPGNHTRHFFLPVDWLSNNPELMIEVTSKGDIVFVKRAEVAVIKRGLDNIEAEDDGKTSKRKSLLGKGRPALHS